MGDTLPIFMDYISSGPVPQPKEAFVYWSFLIAVQYKQDLKYIYKHRGIFGTSGCCYPHHVRENTYTLLR